MDLAKISVTGRVEREMDDGVFFTLYVGDSRIADLLEPFEGLMGTLTFEPDLSICPDCGSALVEMQTAYICYECGWIRFKEI